MMKNEPQPQALYRSVKGSRAANRATVVSSLQYDGTAPVPTDSDRVSWTPRAAALLRELRQEGYASGNARGQSLPFSSLRAAIATVIPEAVMLERDLGSPWHESPRPFLDVVATDGLAGRLGNALSLWVAHGLRPWSERVGASEMLVDALHELAAGAFSIVRREGTLPDVLSAGGAFPDVRDAIVQRFAHALEGRELFEGMGPVWRIVRGRSVSNEIEFMTWPVDHEGALYSMVACITVETIPFSKQPVINVRASRRRWLEAVPSGRALTGQRGVTVTLMGREGPHVALEVSAPIRSLEVEDPIAPEFLGQLLRIGGDAGAPLAELVDLGAGGPSFVGIAYSPKLGGSHPIGAGVSTRDQTDLFDAVQDAVDEIGFVPISFEETPSLKQVPKRSAELHKALETEALLSDVAVAIGRNDLDDDASIEAAWRSLGLDDERPEVSAASAAKARTKLTEVRAANVDRVSRAFGDRKPAVVVIARTDGERQLLQAVLASLFGQSIEVSARPLPADVHGARATLPTSEGKTQKRFEARVDAWRPLTEVLAGIEGGTHALVQATDWYDGKPDDPVNKPAGRYALASLANANVQYLRPRGRGQRGLANYLHRLQAAIYDLVFGHAGLVSDIAGAVTGTFPNAEDRPTSVVGISVLAQSRNRVSSKSGKLCIATRIDCATGQTTARVGWHDGEMRWSVAWEPLFDALKRIASPSIKASLGSGLAVERGSFQSFVLAILDECAEVGDRPLVMVDSTSAASLWPWLTDGQLGHDITLGSERLDVSRRWPGFRIVRVRLGHAARIAERKTAEYRRVDLKTGGMTDEVLERYCPTIIARTVRLSGDGVTAAHYWSTAGYFQMSFPRGLSVYRTLASLVPVAKAFRDAQLPPNGDGLLAPVEIPLYDVSYRLPNPIELTVAAICAGDDPDRIAHLVSSLRYGYGHTAASTSLPAPLSFESKARDYMTRFALDISDEEDDAMAEVGSTGDDAETIAPNEVAEKDDTTFQVTDPRAWRQLVDKSDVSVMSEASHAAVQLAVQDSPDVTEEETTIEAPTAPFDAEGHAKHGNAEQEGEPKWSELAPVIRLPAFVTIDWIDANLTVANSQLRALHEHRHELAKLSGYRDWPPKRPTQREFARILHEGLRYPRFAAAVTQIAKRSVAPAKKKFWSLFRLLMQSAYTTAEGIVRDLGKTRSIINSDRGIAETLAGAGQIDLALGHLFRRAYMQKMSDNLLKLIDTDERFASLREFASDAAEHLFRHDYDWENDLNRMPVRPTYLANDDIVPLSDSEVVLSEEAEHHEDVREDEDGHSNTIGDELNDDKGGEEKLTTDSRSAVSDGGATSVSDGVTGWADAMVAIIAAARGATDPDQQVLDRIAQQVETASEALAAYIASRPRGVDIAPLLDRALEAFSFAFAVLVDAGEPAETLPVAPNGPFASVVEQGLASAIEIDVIIGEQSAKAARVRIAEAQAILRGMQMARLKEAAALTGEAVSSGREAASLAVGVLERLRAGVANESAVIEQSAFPLEATAPSPMIDHLAETGFSSDDVDLDSAADWDSAQQHAVQDEILDEPDLADNALPESDSDIAETLVPSHTEVETDPMRPKLLARFDELMAASRFGLAYHLSLASSAAGLFDAYPVSRPELRLAAITSHVNHAASQGSHLIHRLLVDVEATFATMEDDEQDAVARRIIALASLAPFALYHNDPEAKLALEALRQVGDGLGDAVHAFREALVAPHRSGLALTPSQMRLANEEAQDDEYARALSDRILADLEDFSNKTYKFQLGNKLRIVLMKSDGELGRLRDRVAKGGKAALEATRDFSSRYRDRAQILRLLADAEFRANNFKMTGIDGIARERMVGLIQGIAAVCAEYVETADASPTMKGTIANIQRSRTAIVDATTGLDAALEGFGAAGALERAAVDFARLALKLFLDSVRGVGRTPAPTDHMAAVHGPMLWLRSLDFGQGWLPSPYVPETIVGTLLDSGRTDIDKIGTSKDFVEQVGARTSTGSHIAASMMISMADFYSVPAEQAEALDEALQVDMATRREALTAELREARLMVDRVQRMGGVGSQDEAQSLLSLLDRIKPEDLPKVVPLESRGEAPEPEQILDFKAAYGLVADVRTKVKTLLKRPRDELMVRITAMAKAGAAVEADLDKVRALVARDDLLTATEYLDFLEDGRALPETTSPNPRFRAYFPSLPDQLAAMSRAEQEGISAAIEAGGTFAGLDFGKVGTDRREDALEALQAWSELRRAVGGGRPETEIASRLALMLDRFGLEAEIRSPNARSNRRIYSADMRINLLWDSSSVLLPDFGSRTGGDYRVCISTKMPNEPEVRAIQADAGALRVVYIVTDTVPTERRRQLQLSCLDNQTHLLVVDESMVYFALAEPELRGLTVFELAQPFSFAAPYDDYGNRAVPREMFFGRVSEGRKLFEPHGSCIVYGGRRLGKTALLRHIQDEKDDAASGTAVAYVIIRDLGGNAGQSKIWEYMSRELKAVFPKPVEQAERFSEDVRRWLDGDSRRRVLVLLDESDRFIEADASEHFAQFVRLQKLMDDTNRRFKFVLAGLHNVTRLVHTENPPLKQIASDPQRIGPLMDEELGDAEALVTRPLAGMGYEFENREDVWRILSYCNYYPVLVQKFCKELLQELVREATKRRRVVSVITADHIRAALENEYIAKEIGETFDFTIKIDDRYSLIANIVADRALRDSASGRIGEGMSAVEVRDAAASWWGAAFSDANRLAIVEDLLDEMEGLGVLRRVPPDRWALRSPTILRLLGHDDKIAAKLGEFMDRAAPPVFDPRSMRRKLKANQNMQVAENAICPLTLGQEHDLLRDRAPVTLIFGSAVSDIGMVTGALASLGVSGDERGVVEVSARSFASVEAMVKELKGAAQGEAPILHVVHDRSAWDAGWVDQALRVRAVRHGRARVIFVGRAEHALAWVLDPRSPSLSREVRIVPLQTWSATLIEETLEQEHLDPTHFRAPLREATGGFNHLMQQLVGPGSSLTARTLTNRLQAAVTRRRRDPALPAELGLIGSMLKIFHAIVEFTQGEITAYEIGEGPVADLALDLTGQSVVDFGVLMGLLEAQPTERVDSEDARPFRVNPLLLTLFGAKAAQ